MRKSVARHELAKDVFFIIVGACFALILSDAGIIDRVIPLFGNSEVASFVAGLFLLLSLPLLLPLWLWVI